MKATEKQIKKLYWLTNPDDLGITTTLISFQDWCWKNLDQDICYELISALEGNDIEKAKSILKENNYKF